jgi:hypothetical protein
MMIKKKKVWSQIEMNAHDTYFYENTINNNNPITTIQ